MTAEVKQRPPPVFMLRSRQAPGSRISALPHPTTNTRIPIINDLRRAIALRRSFYFLLHIPKQVGIKKVLYCYIKAVAYLFYCGDCGAVVSSADYIVQRRLCYSANSRQLVYRNSLFPTQLFYPIFCCLPDGHIFPPIYTMV